MAPVSKYDPLCDVVEDWYEMHKQLTRDGIKIPGVGMREWQLVFHEKSRHLWTDEHRANVLRAVANAARRVTGT